MRKRASVRRLSRTGVVTFLLLATFIVWVPSASAAPPNWWVCKGEPQKCTGETNTSNVILERWTCDYFRFKVLCAGNIDTRDSANEAWVCVWGETGFRCLGNIDKTDSANEAWKCRYPDASRMRCSGNIWKGDSYAETWKCRWTDSATRCDGLINGDRTVEYWGCDVYTNRNECWGNAGRLSPVLDTYWML